MITIRDIAKLSGYSVTTVSRALNDHDDVNPDTKAAIRAIADREGYAPNILAQGLVSRDSKTFGFITSNFKDTSPTGNFTFILFMKSIERANALGYDIVMIHYDSDSYKKKTFEQLIAERNLSGAILQGFDQNDALCQEALHSDVPTVFIDIGFSNETTTHVISNIEKAADIGFNYLLNKCGYENIIFVFGSEESWVTNEWKAAVTKAKTKYQNEIHSFATLNGHYRLEKAQIAIKKNQALLNHDKLAIFCASDLMGIGIMRELKILGVKVPDDVGILGYDGVDITEYINPTLSTITQYPDKIGAQAVNLLIDLKNKVKVSVTDSIQKIDVDLIERESTRRVDN